MSFLICFVIALFPLWQVKALISQPIREFVGHSEDSKEIERVYLHVIKKQKDTMRGAVEKLEKLIE